MANTWRARYRKEHAHLLVARLRWCAGLALAGSISLGIESALFAGPMMRPRLGIACAYGAVSVLAWLSTYWQPARERPVPLALVYLFALIALMASDYAPNDPDLAATGFVALIVGVMVLLPWGARPQALIGAATLAGYAWVLVHATGPPNMGAVSLVVCMAFVAVAAAELIEQHRASLFERTWQQEQLVSLARDLAQEIEPECVIAKVIEHGLVLIPVGEIALSVRDATRRTYRVAAAGGPDAQRVKAFIDAEFPENYPVAVRIVEEGIREMIDDDPANPLGAFLRERGVRRVLHVALRHGGEVVGIVAFVRREAVPFSAGERLLARGLADQAALALRTAQVVADLRRVNELKSDFVSTMSHELRTPLNVITGYTDLIAEGTFGSLTDDMKDTVGRVQHSARELLDLVNATLDLGRLEAGRDPVSLAEIDLEGLFAELGREFEPLVPAAVALRWHTSPDARHIVSDRVKLKTILKNLVGNALKFTAAGSVEFHATLTRGVLLMEVRDTGIGIAPEYLPVIFDMFRQVDGSSTRRFGGVGLGLHIVKRLVEKLAGTITVESTPGAGSIFTVRLPATGEMPLRVAA